MKSSGVEYLLKAKDMLSPVFAQASRGAKDMQQSVSAIATTTAQEMGKVGAQVGQTVAKTATNVQQSVSQISKIVYSGVSKTGVQATQAITKTATGARQSVSRMDAVTAGSIRRTGAHIHHMMDRARSSANSLAADNRQLGRSYDQLAVKIRQVGNSISGSGNRMSMPEMGGKGGGLAGMLGGVSIKSMLGSIGLAVGLGAAVSAGTGFAKDAINMGLERQQIQTSFNVLAGSNEAGGALTQQLVGLQKDTILGAEVFKNAQTMMGFGFDSKEIYSNLKMLGDVSMGDANKLQSLTLAFSQIKSAGKLAGQDLLQLINAGFNPLEQMAKTTGKTIGQLKEQMEKGLIPFSAVQLAFRQATSEGGRFDNMLGKIAETPAGKLQQLSGAWDEFKIQAGAAMMPLVSMALDIAQKVLPIIEKLIVPLTKGVESIAGWIHKAKESSGGWVGSFNMLKDTIQNQILPLMSKMWDLVGNVASTIFEMVGSSELLQDVFKMIMVNVKITFMIISKLIDNISWAFTNIIKPQLEMVEKAYKLIKGLVGGKSVQGIAPITPGGIKKPGVDPTTLNNATTPPTTTNYNPSDKIKSIAGGGSRPTHIYVNLNKEMVGQITINPITMSQGAEDVKEMMMQALSQILNSANRIALE